MSNIMPYGTVKAHELLWNAGIRDRRELKNAILKEGLEELWNKTRRNCQIGKLEKRVQSGWLSASKVTDARMDEHPSKEFPVMYYFGNTELLNEELIGIAYQKSPKRMPLGKNQISFDNGVSNNNSIEFQRAWISHSLNNNSINLIVLDEDISYLLSGVSFNPHKLVGIMPHGFNSTPGARNNKRLELFRNMIIKEGLVLSPYPITAGSRIQAEGYLLLPELSDKINVVNINSDYPARHAIEVCNKPIKYFRS